MVYRTLQVVIVLLSVFQANSRGCSGYEAADDCKFYYDSLLGIACVAASYAISDVSEYLKTKERSYNGPTLFFANYGCSPLDKAVEPNTFAVVERGGMMQMSL